MKTPRHRKKKSELVHDHLFRGAFSLKPIVQAHLLEALSLETMATLDLDSLELASETHIDGDLRAAFSGTSTVSQKYCGHTCPNLSMF